jgi:LssY C-terminus
MDGSMPKNSMKSRLLWASCAVSAAICPSILHAQLVREDLSSAKQAQPPATTAPTTGVQTLPGKGRLSQELQITGEQFWTDTGIDVKPGEHVVISATGKMRYAEAPEDNGPEGQARSFKDLLRILPLPNGGRGALIGRIGDKDIGQPLLLGAHQDIIAPVGGRLWIGINQMSNDIGEGTYKVRVEVNAADAGSNYAAVKVVDKIPGIDDDLFTKIPRRIGDKDGNPGDMVNFLIIGSEDSMKKVFTSAGWVHVDADVRGTVLQGLIASLSKESYLTMPMSPLYLFGRSQDYGWAHAEPISVVASRNHLRVWKAPFEVHGQMLWVGAATHDIGFERDNRNNGITHKIDPDIDLERDYVEKTLSSTGQVSEVSHFIPENPMREAKTATGGSFHSNGQVLILKLRDSAKDLSAASENHPSR